MGASAGIGAFQLVIAPLWLLPASNYWLWPLGVSVCLAPFQWAVIHEAIHGMLLPSQRGTLAAGRLLSVAYGVPFRLLGFGHHLHHRYNRCAIDRPEVYDPEREAWLRAALRYYAYLLGGMYFRSVAAGLLMLGPRRFVRWAIERTLPGVDLETRQIRSQAIDKITGRYLAELRMDAGLMVAVHAGAAMAYGPHLAAGLAVFCGRGLLISLTDNVYHYRTPLSARTYAKNLSLPGWCRGLLLNVNYHRVHHRFPYVPWRGLPVWDPPQGVPDATFLRGVAAQLRGPIPMAGSVDSLAQESRRSRVARVRANSAPVKGPQTGPFGGTPLACKAGA